MTAERAGDKARPVTSCLAVRVPSLHRAERAMARDPWLRLDTEPGVTLPLAGQPGHGRTAYLRRQPARIVDGRMEGGYTGAFELICGQCGDHPYLDYFEIPPWLQQIRGPYMLEAGLAAYENHLGPETAG
jgi:hypothetical protein